MDSTSIVQNTKNPLNYFTKIPFSQFSQSSEYNQTFNYKIVLSGLDFKQIWRLLRNLYGCHTDPSMANGMGTVLASKRYSFQTQYLIRLFFWAFNTRAEYSNMRSMYFNGAKGAIFIFNFDDLLSWYKVTQLYDYLEPPHSNIPILVLGLHNEAMYLDKDGANRKECRAWAQSKNVCFKESKKNDLGRIDAIISEFSLLIAENDEWTKYFEVWTPQNLIDRLTSNIPLNNQDYSFMGQYVKFIQEKCQHLTTDTYKEFTRYVENHFKIPLGENYIWL